MSGKFIKFFLLSAIVAILIAYFFKPIVTYLHAQFGFFSEHRYVVTGVLFYGASVVLRLL